MQHDHDHGHGHGGDGPTCTTRPTSTSGRRPGTTTPRRSNGPAVADAIREAVPVTGDTRLLEYGAGTGLLAQFLAPHVGPLTLADPSEGMRAVMHDKVERGDLPGAEVVDIGLATGPASTSSSR